MPKRWQLTRQVDLHDWQRRCVNAWFDNGRRGVIKVVTGAGKTILALAIAERLQEEQQDLRVAVIVPTVVLLNQWRDELITQGNLPPKAIGLMGGGHTGGFAHDVRFLLCVLNSAAAKLADEVERTGIGDRLLLIVDECHRAGAEVMRQGFRTRRAYSLGLSATPKREPSDEEDERTAQRAVLSYVTRMADARSLSEPVLRPRRLGGPAKAVRRSGTLGRSSCANSNVTRLRLLTFGASSGC